MKTWFHKLYRHQALSQIKKSSLQHGTWTTEHQDSSPDSQLSTGRHKLSWTTWVLEKWLWLPCLLHNTLSQLISKMISTFPETTLLNHQLFSPTCSPKKELPPQRSESSASEPSTKSRLNRSSSNTVSSTGPFTRWSKAMISPLTQWITCSDQLFNKMEVNTTSFNLRETKIGWQNLNSLVTRLLRQSKQLSWWSTLKERSWTTSWTKSFTKDSGLVTLASLTNVEYQKETLVLKQAL